MSRRAYMRYSEEALNRQYNNREQRPDGAFEAFVRCCQARSANARSELACALDISFGPDSDERLDIFMPELRGDAPVNIFFHGGYWRASTKEDFSYVAFGGIPNGVMTVVVNYGLIPRVSMGGLIDQCRRAVAWTYRNIGAHGGDPTRLYISGHSAGAHIVSMLLSTDWQTFDSGLAPNLIKGACAISGIYDLDPVRRTFLNKILQFTDDDVMQFSTIALKPVIRCPLLCAVGGDESSEFIRQTQDFAEQWLAHGMPVDLSILPGKDHFSIREDLGSPDAPMTALMLEHLRRTVR